MRGSSVSRGGEAMAGSSALLSPGHPRRFSSTHKCASPGSMAWRGILTIVLIFCDAHFSAADVAHARVRLPKAFHRQKGDLHREATHEGSGNSSQVQRFFEVSKPVTEGERPVESIQLLYHEFANTYGIPPPSARYIPTKKVRGHHKWDKVVLRWSAVCRGRQFDRIAAVWLGGVEILRTCTAEPTPDGIFWEVEKDVTRYASLWKEPQEVVVAIGNVVDNTYTGIINVTLSVQFYHGKGPPLKDVGSVRPIRHHGGHSKLEDYAREPADVILPVNEASCEDGGCWFQLAGEADQKSASLKIPSNTYKAVLEVCVSPHGDDEFWYTNPPNEYLEANNITGVPGNGTFREVVVAIDDKLVGAVSPIVVVYTGGVNPLFWRPIAAIGAFNLPSYDLDITPFVGYLLDGEAHTFSLTVTDALSMWFLQANLHLWVDPRRTQTVGSLLKYSVQSSGPEVSADYRGVDGSFTTTASKTVSYAGLVKSSFGAVTTSSIYTFTFSNTLRFANNSEVNTVYQVTNTWSRVVAKTPKEDVTLDRREGAYPFSLYFREVVNADNSANVSASIDHALDSHVGSLTKTSSSYGTFSNVQSSKGEMFISVNNTISGIGATDQRLSELTSEGCYQRIVSAKNYTVLKDASTTICFRP